MSSSDGSMNDSPSFSLLTDDQIDRKIQGWFEVTEGNAGYVEHTGPPLLASTSVCGAVRAHMRHFHCCKVKLTFSDAGGLVVEVFGGQLSVAGAGLPFPSTGCVKLKWCIPASSEHKPHLVQIPLDILGPDGQLQQQLSSINTKQCYPIQSLAAVVCYRLAVEILQQLRHVPGHKALVTLARRLLRSAELWVLLRQFRPSAELLVQQPAQLSRELLLAYVGSPPCAQHAAMVSPCSRGVAVDTCALVALLHQLDPLPVGIRSKAAVQQALKRLLQKYPPHRQQQALQQLQQQPAQQQQAEVSDAELTEWLGLQSLELDDVVEAAAEHVAHCCWCGETNHLIKCSSCCHEYHLSCDTYQQYSHFFSPSTDLDPEMATNGKPKCLACQGFPLSDTFWEYVSTQPPLDGTAAGAASSNSATGSRSRAAARRRRAQCSSDMADDIESKSETDMDGSTKREHDDRDPAFRPGRRAAAETTHVQHRANRKSTLHCCPADVQPLLPPVPQDDEVAVAAAEAAVQRGAQLITWLAANLKQHNHEHSSSVGKLLRLGLLHCSEQLLTHGLLHCSEQQPLHADLMQFHNKHRTSNNVLAHFTVRGSHDEQQQCNVLECHCGRRFDSLSSAELHIHKHSFLPSERLWISGCLMRDRHSGQMSPLTLKDLWEEASHLYQQEMAADLEQAVPPGSVADEAASGAASTDSQAGPAAAAADDDVGTAQAAAAAAAAGFHPTTSHEVSRCSGRRSAEQQREAQQQRAAVQQSSSMKCNKPWESLQGLKNQSRQAFALDQEYVGVARGGGSGGGAAVAADPEGTVLSEGEVQSPMGTAIINVQKLRQIMKRKYSLDQEDQEDPLVKTKRELEAVDLVVTKLKLLLLVEEKNSVLATQLNILASVRNMQQEVKAAHAQLHASMTLKEQQHQQERLEMLQQMQNFIDATDAISNYGSDSDNGE